MEILASGFLASFALAQYVYFMSQVLTPMLPSGLGYLIDVVFHTLITMMFMSLWYTVKTDPGTVPWDVNSHGHYRVGSPLNFPVTSRGDDLASPEVR